MEVAEGADMPDEGGSAPPPPAPAAAEEAKPPPPPPAPTRPLSLEDVVDDFSLPSRGMRFRAAGREMKIYDQPHGQLILEERGGVPDDDEEQAPIEDGANEKGRGGVLIKSAEDKSYAFSFVRASYSLIAVFVSGFLFILGVLILLFLFIDLTTQLGVTSSSGLEPINFIGALLSVPVWIYSLAMGMTLVGRFVVDTFNGHPFFRSFGMGVATTDWIAFVLYLGVPIVTYVVTLFAKLDNWWEISLMAWFASILLFWCFFSACMLCLELWVFYQLIDEDEGTHYTVDDSWRGTIRYWLGKIANGIESTMTSRLSGKRHHLRKMDIANGVTSVEKRCSNTFSVANKSWNPCYVQNPTPVQLHTLDELLGNTTYVTRYSWSLEKLFCRRFGLTSAIPITNGESSITEVQINSNIACNIIGNISLVLLFTSLMVWFGAPSSVLAIMCLFVAFFFVKVGFSTYRMFLLRRDVVSGVEESTTVYRFWETYQHSKPKKAFVWTWIAAEVLLLYLLPLIYLSNKQNWRLATLFALLGALSALHHYMNPRTLLLESERKDYFRNTFDIKTREDQKRWKKNSMLFHLVSVGGDSARRFWVKVYVVFVVFFALIAVWAAMDYHQNYQDLDSPAPAPASEPVLLVSGYSYEPQPHMPYPTCQIEKGFEGNEFDLQDFAFLAKLAYAGDDEETTNILLDQWFGPGIAVNNVELIEEFKSSSSYEDYGFSGSAVSYKCITFPSINGAVVTIRGTQTVWDMIANAQLWLAATLFQGLRFVLPLSEIFTSILHHMVWIVTQLESDSLTEVAYYRETRGFVEYLKETAGLGVVVTGHSLGGGLALITGAQSDTNAVGISAPNAKLSRDSYFPPVTVDALDTFTFNVIPSNDPVPMVDDVALLYQNINCTAASNDMIGCHDSSRSICEIQYSCGSRNRPVLCECVLKYFYPTPTPTSNATTQSGFLQSCLDICEEDGWSSTKCARWKEEYGR